MDRPDASFWNLPLDSLQSQLEATQAGLSEREARARTAQFGPNTLRDHGERPLLIQYLSHFKNPLVMILLAASAVSALTGEITGFVIIWAIVLMSVTLDFFQEYRAGRAADQLKKTVAVRATVLRDGNPQEITTEKLVPGDVVLLSAGDLIPADCRLREAKDFFINQSLLTGESYPVEKHALDLPVPAADLSQAGNAVFMGTSVISGMARAMVCRTGAGTAVGDIADSLQAKPPPTAFELGTQSFGMLIMRLTFLLVGDEAYYSRVGFKAVPKGRASMPGPVDYSRLLVAVTAQRDQAAGHHRSVVDRRVRSNLAPVRAQARRSRCSRRCWRCSARRSTAFAFCRSASSTGATPRTGSGAAGRGPSIADRCPSRSPGSPSSGYWSSTASS